MKILDLPDSQDNIIRKVLLNQDDKVLDDVSKKSKQDIMIFLKEQKNKENELNNQKNEQKLSQIDSKSNEKDAQNKQENHRENQKLNQKENKLNQDIQKIKSVFTPQILEQNSDIA
ncbi:MAG: hypothetical protein RBT22_13050 [Aliarcobacter sp.]|jgi:hypothetical protein|nr:hypothetical protein [Aliarcobacter sp.]